MPRWRLAAGSLAPLGATAIMALLGGRGVPGTLLLLAAVAFGYLFAGRTAGIAALILASLLYGLIVVPVRGSAPSYSWETLALGVVFLLAGGALMAVLSQLRAASERAEHAREAAERHAQQLAERIDLIGPMLDAAPVGFALLDTGLRYQQVNSAYRALCTPGADPTGQSITDCELPGGVLDGCCRALAEGRPIDAEATVPGSGDGRRDLVVGCYPVRLGDDVIGVAVMIVDVTERHRLAQLELEAASLRVSAELAYKLEEAQRLAGFASWEYDVATGKYRYSRQLSAILGIEQAGFDSLESVGAQVHPDDAARVQAAHNELMARHVPFSQEYRLVRPDGKVLDVLSSGEAFRDTSGQVVRLWGTIQDVTVQRAAERAARDAVRHAEQARADLEVEHQALQMFQRAMLPAELPKLDAVDLHAVYLPMAERIDIGGDWYDAFLLPDGRLALAVGDVTGHDLRAATVMGQVRNAVRAYATEHPEPGAVLARANTLLARLPDLDLVTMLFGVYDPARHELVWSNAGHPPPLLRRGRAVTTLTLEGGLLLGVIPDGDPYPEHRLRLAPGDAVLWYTDGIVDHRSIDPVVALEQLCHAFGRAAGGAGELLGTVSADMLAGGQREDDVCMLVLRRAGEPAGAVRERRAHRRGRPAPGPATATAPG